MREKRGYFRKYSSNRNVSNRSIRRRHRLRRQRIETRKYNFRRKPYLIRPLKSVWSDLCLRNSFCDAVLETSDHAVFQVHRVILAASSDYLRALFTNSLSSTQTHVHFDYSSEVVEKLIEYCYNGTCSVNANNVESLLAAADQLEIIGLVQLCCSFLRNHIDTRNGWGIHIFCRKYYCDSVSEEAKRYILHNFKEFFPDKSEFFKITFKDLYNLLSDDCLNVNDEELVFNAVDQWIKHDLNNRKQCSSKLLSCVRVNYLNKSFYHETVLQAPYIEYVEQNILDLMNAAVALGPSSFTLWTDPRSGETEIIGEQPLFWPRIPYHIVFAFGGWSAGSPTNCVETFDIKANRWFICPEADAMTRAYHGLVCVNNLIYIIGGFDGSNHFNTVLCYDPVIGIWTEKACMYNARSYVSCILLDDCIYAIGGYNGRSRMSSVEKYSISRNQWEKIARMNSERSGAGATVCNSMIYVAGGFNGDDILMSVEVYNPATNTWSFIASMNTPRMGFSLIEYKCYLYAIGGFNGVQTLKSMERFSPYHSFYWEESLPDMTTKRSNFSCTILDEIIFVVGGFIGSNSTPRTEYYDGHQWRPLASMNVSRSALSICTVSGLPNAAAYSLYGKVKRKSN